jgi:hypothetical protein
MALEDQSIAGWKPPLIYDVSTDTTRLATQADIKRLELLQRAYTNMQRFLAEIEREHQQLMAAYRAVDTET